MESAHVILEAEKTQDPQGASWRPRRAGVWLQSESQESQDPKKPTFQFGTEGQKTLMSQLRALKQDKFLLFLRKRESAFFFY